MSTPSTLDAAAIQALVTEVVRRIQAAHAIQPTPATPAVPARPASVATPVPATAAFSIPDRVVTLAHVAEAHALQESATVGRSAALAGKIVIEP